METGFFSMTIVQVALSIVISWALFALLCSMIQELIVQVKSERGRFFRSKVLDKLYDATNQINWGLLIYNHSNIKLLTKSSDAPPSDISSKMLAETLIDSVAFAHATQILKSNSTDRVLNFKNDLLNDLEFAVNNLGQSDVIVMLKNYLSKAKVNASTTTGYDEEKLYKSLTADLQIWFDEFGNRTSKWYKKISQKRLFFLGLLVASATNIDSVALFNFYKENPTARKEVEAFYFKNQKYLEDLKDTYDDQKAELKKIDSIKSKAEKEKVTVKDSTVITMDSTQVFFEEINAKTVNKTKEDIDKLTKKIDSLKTQINLPIGWDKAICISSKKDNPDCKCDKSSIFSISCILFKILGIIITALAASLGAPFWFDLLKKATSMNILKK